MSGWTQTVVMPLKVDAHGVVYVGDTRVTLDTVIAAFRDGSTTEEIIHQYPSLELADVYHVIGYYLRHPNEVNSYLQLRQSQSAMVRRENEIRFDPLGVRDRLMRRGGGTR